MKSLPACLQWHPWTTGCLCEKGKGVWWCLRVRSRLRCIEWPCLSHITDVSAVLQRPLLHRSDCRRWLFYSSLLSIGKPWTQPSLHLPSAEMADVSLHSCPAQWMTQGPVLRKVVSLHCWLWLWEVRSWTFCVGSQVGHCCLNSVCPGGRSLSWAGAGWTSDRRGACRTTKAFDQQGLWLHVHAACHNECFFFINFTSRIIFICTYCT